MIKIQGKIAIFNTRMVQLSKIERQIIKILLGQPNQPVSNNEIINQVWGENGSDPEVLRLNIYRMRKKLELNPAKPQFIKNKRGQGYYISDPHQV